MIANRYRIDAEIGKGGMGTVYKAYDTQTSQTVAIKHLKPELTAPELIERFKREGEALRELNHPNIVKMLDAVEENGNHYLIIEYLVGGDLDDLLKRGKLPLDRVLQIAIDICDALTRAHRLNIIHRDLKPENVLLAEDGTPRLSDFGVAHISAKQRVTETDVIIGTVDYLAPEALRDNRVDTRTDIWALGVVLFKLLTGELPFKGATVIHKMHAIATQPVPDLESLCPNIPIALVDLIYRMLEKDYHARIASVRQIGLELENIAKGRITDTHLRSRATRFATQPSEMSERSRHNLPALSTPFVGRETEIANLKHLLTSADTRFVTVLAPGGMGKTWLALETARQIITDFADGVFWVDLAPLQDMNAIVMAIATATNYPFQNDNRSYKQQILDFLANKHILLIFDNFEHLLTAAELVHEIVLATTNLHVLVTSREKLHQSNETVYTLGGMNYPDWYYDPSQSEYDAISLFLQTARHIQPHFEFKQAEIQPIIHICQMVQGLPLGIVLAASWLGMLTPTEIADELTRSIDILETDATDVSERHRSIRAVFDYSWNVMNETDHQVFMKLTICRDGFTREAATTISGATLRNLMSLMNQSLIQRDMTSGRYTIHELLRQYGFEQLQKSGNLTTVCQLHSEYYLKLISIRRTDFKQNRQLEMLALMGSDGENIRRAWQWAIEYKQFDHIANALENLSQFYDIRQLPKEKYALLQTALQRVQLADDENLYLHLLSSTWLTPQEGRAHVRTTLAIASERKNARAIAHCLYQRGTIALKANHYTTAAYLFNRAYKCYCDLPHEAVINVIAAWIISLIYSGRLAEAEALASDMLPTMRRSDNLSALAQTVANYGSILLMRGAVDEALNYYQEARELYLKLGNRLAAAHIAVFGMSFAALRQGDFEQVRLYAEELLALATEYEQDFGVARAYCMLSNVALVEGDAQTSYDLADAAIRLFDGHVNTIEAEIFRALAATTLCDYATAQKALQKWLAVTWRSRNLALLSAELTMAAALLVHRGKTRQAHTVLKCALQHPATGGKWLETVIKNLEVYDSLRHWQSDDASPDLETVVSELLREFGEDEA